MKMEYQKVDHALRAQALLVHALFSEFGIYRVPIQTTGFNEAVKDFLEDQIDQASQDGSSFYKVLDRFATNITLHLWELLLSEHGEMQSVFTAWANSFHRCLADENLYEKPVSDQDFNQISSHIISSSIQNVLQRRTCYLVEVLLLPGSIVYELGDYLNFDGYGYQAKPNLVLNTYQRLFQKAGMSVFWEIDVKKNLIQLEINGDNYEVSDMEFGVYFGERIYKIHNVFSNHANKCDYTIFDFALGDTTGLFVLIPKSSAEKLSRYLLSNDDPRTSLVYAPHFHHINVDNPTVAHMNDSSS